MLVNGSTFMRFFLFYSFFILTGIYTIDVGGLLAGDAACVLRTVRSGKHWRCLSLRPPPPTLAGLLFPPLPPSLPTCSVLEQAFWSDGFTSCEWAGKASLAAAGLAGVVITRWQGLFLEDGDGSPGTWCEMLFI